MLFAVLKSTLDLFSQLFSSVYNTTLSSNISLTFAVSTQKYCHRVLRSNFIFAHSIFLFLRTLYTSNQRVAVVHRILISQIFLDERKSRRFRGCVLITHAM